MAQARSPGSWESSPLPDRVPWRDVHEHLSANWKQGQHFGIMAPTGAGKTVLISQGLMPEWSHGLFLDPKGGADNLQWAKRLGAKVVRRHPQPHVVSVLRRSDPYPDRYYWLNPPLKDSRTAFAECFGTTWRRGGWVIAVDEVKLMSDPHELDLGRFITRALRYGRGRRITFIGATQSPRWNGPQMSDLYDQPSWFALGRTRDRRTIDRYGEISGFESDVARDVLPSLGEHEFWIIGPGDYSVVSRVRLKRRLPTR